MTARVTKEIASARALAILRAMADVLEGARKGRSWQAFELEWFGRRVEEAREAQALLIELHVWDEVRLETADEEKALAELERLDLAHGLAEGDAAPVVRASARGGELMVEVGVWAMLDRLRRSLSGAARMSQASFDALDASDRAFFAQAVIPGLPRGRFVDGEPITDRDLRLALSFFRFRDRGRVRRLQAELRERRALAKRESV